MKADVISKFILADTGFWIGLCDSGRSEHQLSVSIYGRAARFHFVMPWPLFYEVLRTKFVKSPSKIDSFDKALRDSTIEQVDDGKYRERALEMTLKSAKEAKRTISLVDMVLRLMLDDLRIDGLITFNARDFSDVCRRRQIPLIENLTTFAAV